MVEEMPSGSHAGAHVNPFSQSEHLPPSLPTAVQNSQPHRTCVLVTAAVFVTPTPGSSPAVSAGMEDSLVSP